MILQERIEKLTDNKNDYDRLYDADYLYFVYNKDEKTLEKFVQDIDDEYYVSRDAIRGDRKSYGIEDDGNKDRELVGYVYNVNQEQMDTFEKVSLMPSMKYSYRFEKYDLNKTKQQEQQEILERLQQGEE
jgi:hypothetical protein